MTSEEEMAAFLAIGKVKSRYCRMVDTKDWAGLAALVTEDFELDVSEGTGVPVVHGRDAAIAMISASIGTATTVHQVHIPEMEIDGDRADVIWPMQDRVLWGGDRPSITGYGYYHEHYVRRDGQWRIARLRLSRLHIDTHAPAAP